MAPSPSPGHPGNYDPAGLSSPEPPAGSEAFDRLPRLAAALLQAPVALLALAREGQPPAIAWHGPADVTPPEGMLVLSTMRSHDQWNTVPYALDDRYRGIHNGRRVVLINPADIEELGLADRQLVDLISTWDDGVERRAKGFRVVAYPAARGSAASYYPETNVLVPLDSVAELSNTPTSKGVFVRLEPAAP